MFILGVPVLTPHLSSYWVNLMTPVLASLPEGQRALNYTSYLEPFFVYLKVAIYGGLFLAAPWVLWQLWLFVAPGLYKREKKVVIPFLVLSDARLALRASYAVAILMLFCCGYVFGIRSGLRPWAAGLAMVAVGGALVGIAVALGG